MKLNHKSQEQIRSVIRTALEAFPCNGSQPAITDIYLQPNQQTGELLLFNDEDKDLAVATIEEWIGCEDTEFYKHAERILRNILTKLKESGDLEKASILQPYSFVLVDEDKETIADLLLQDDDIMLIHEELLKGLDQELDSFLKELLES